MQQPGRSLTRRALSLLAPDATSICAYVAVLMALAACSVLPAILFGKIIDARIRSGNPGLITRLGLATVTMTCLTAVLALVSQWMSSRLAEGITYRARVRIFDHVRRLPVAFTNHSDTGALVNRVLNDVTGLQAMTETLASLLSGLATATSIFIAIAAVDGHIALFVLGVFPLFHVPARWATGAMTEQHQARLNSAAGLATFTNELVSPGGALLSRLFSTRARDVSSFAGRALELRRAGVRLALLNGLFLGCLGLMAAGGTAGVFWLGAMGVTTGALTVGGLVAAVTLTSQLYVALTSIASTPVSLTAAIVSMRRMFEIFDLPVPPAGFHSLPPGAGSVELRNVCFTYPSREASSPPSLQGATNPGVTESALPVLRGLSLKLAPGSTTALIGVSGAGKTTIGLLVAGVYAPSSGLVLIDGINIADLRPEEVSGAVGFVSQDTYLLHDTVRANLLFAKPDACHDELVAAARAAGIDDVIRDLPLGYDTVVGSHGFRLSGGQRQRVALARVLLRRPRVVVLDEATAHLDAETGREVRARVQQLLAGTTLLIITHHLATVTSTARVLEVVGGSIRRSRQRPAPDKVA